MGAGAVVPSTERSGPRLAGRPVGAAQRKQRRQRPNKQLSLKQTIDHVAEAESLQERGARRFPIWESGGSPPHYNCDEARQEITCRAHRLYRDRQIARRL